MMKTLNICMVCSEFPPKGAGIAQAAYNLSKGLVDIGHHVSVVTRGGAKRTEVENINGINVYRVPFFFFPPPLNIKLHAFFVRNAILCLGKLDIVHFHSPLAPKIELDIPSVLTVHSCWSEESETFKKVTDVYSLYIRLFTKAFIRVERKSLRSADAVVALSRSMVSEIRSYEEHPIDIEVVGNGIDLSIFKDTNIEKVDAEPRKKFDLVFVGRLVYRKGITDLMECTKKLCAIVPQARILIVGNGPLENKLRRYVRSNNLTENVLMLGKLPNGMLPAYLRTSKVFVLPSHYEPFGIVTAEAMACGLPVVGTAEGGTLDLVRDGYNGILVNKRDPAGLCEAILQLLEKPDLLKTMGERSRKIVEDQFTQQKIAQNYSRVYAELISRKKDQIPFSPRTPKRISNALPPTA